MFPGECLNYILLGVQFFLTDMFLNYKFSWYGWDVIVYYNIPYTDRISMSGGIRYYHLDNNTQTRFSVLSQIGNV